MTMETGRKAIELAMQSPAKHLTFEFQGGEPLLNFDVIIEMIEHSKRLNESLKKNIEYTIVTNLVALTDEILQKLIDHHVSICTSLDGDKSVHDHNRKLHNGEGSYEAVYKNITKIRNAGLSVGAIETTTQYSLQYPKEIIDTYISNQVNGIFLRPMTPLGFAKAYWDEIGYTPEQFLCFYREAFLYILEINKHGIHFPELHATYFLKKILGGYADNYMELRSPCGAGVGQMSYYWDGSVYTCDEGRMISESGDFAFRLGNVYENTYDELIDSPICKATCAASVVESLPKCCDCAYHPYCGVCPVVVYSDEHDIFPHSPFDYRCAVYAGILDLLFELIHEADEATMQVLYRWIED
jgi:His-Xaa-Ser system radical SAM maturase HxsB